MSDEIERNLGEQPIAKILLEEDLTAHKLVEVSTEHITHKMVSRACKGRRLTSNTKVKVRNALNLASGKEFSVKGLFNY